MSTFYPPGTRVVYVGAPWTHGFPGETGEATGEVYERGELVRIKGEPFAFEMTEPAQVVDWDKGVRTNVAVSDLRPIENPDAEPETHEKEKQA